MPFQPVNRFTGWICFLEIYLYEPRSPRAQTVEPYRRKHTHSQRRWNIPPALQIIKEPFREVWRAKALQMQSESGDMCGGFGSLALQGFLAPFPAREPHGGERETA